MAEYLFTSPKMSGFMKFGYDDKGVIVKFENSASIDPTQQSFLKSHFPWSLSDLPRIRGKEGKIQEITDTSFETFWEKYNYKKGRVKAEQYWKRLDESSKAMAIMAIPRFKYDCKIHNREMVYPERYIKDRRFEDE